MAIKRGLGRGLGALIKDGTAQPAEAEAPRGIRKVPIDRITASAMQPRHTFDEDALSELTDSIKELGVIQPLLVRSTANGYEIIAGERRLRAATTAGVQEVPVIVMDADDGDSLELALVENLQREDLNVLEEAEGYQLLTDKFGLTQEEVAARVGKARASVANTVRLLSLPAEIKQLITGGELSAGHAKLLSGLEIEQEQVMLARRAVKESLSVRNLEKLIQKSRRAPRKPRASRADIPDSHMTHLSDRLHSHFGTSIRVSSCKTLANGKKARGSIEIDFYSTDDLDRILQLLGLGEE